MMHVSDFDLTVIYVLFYESNVGMLIGQVVPYLSTREVSIQRRQQQPPIATWRRSFTFFADDAVQVAGTIRPYLSWKHLHD
jgi:hypothetical protein